MKRSSEYVKIYDHFYSKFAKQVEYIPTERDKINAIDSILSDLSFKDNEAIHLYIRFYYSMKKSLGDDLKTVYVLASKNSGIKVNKIAKMYELASKHMYYPNNISIAVPNYYDWVKKHDMLSDTDFGGKKYIITALHKSGIYYKEQLNWHLHNGWYYLWTIPGIGDGAKQQILRSIDKWNENGEWQ